MGIRFDGLGLHIFYYDAAARTVRSSGAARPKYIVHAHMQGTELSLTPHILPKTLMQTQVARQQYRALQTDPCHTLPHS